MLCARANRSAARSSNTIIEPARGGGVERFGIVTNFARFLHPTGLPVTLYPQAVQIERRIAILSALVIRARFVVAETFFAHPYNENRFVSDRRKLPFVGINKGGGA